MDQRAIYFCLLLLLMSWGGVARSEQAHIARELRIATFDSGFGGFFTAKSIEQVTPDVLRNYDAEIGIRHYGDTKNSPYGEKAPEKIAELGSDGVLKAIRDGADLVFIACNTASTQYEQILKTIERVYPGRGGDVVSIIAASTAEAKRLIDARLEHVDHVNFAILATPATLKSMAYPRLLARVYEAPLEEGAVETFQQARWLVRNGATVESAFQRSVLHLPGGKSIAVYQMAPANWVEMIEQGADLKAKNEIVARDMDLFLSRLPQGAVLDVMGYFCTHFPVFDAAIRMAVLRHQRGEDEMSYIAQGPLMAAIYLERVRSLLNNYRRKVPLENERLAKLISSSRASITISGDNALVTAHLAQSLFPSDPPPRITQEDFALANVGAVSSQSGRIP